MVKERETNLHEGASTGFRHLFERVQRGEVTKETAAHLLGISRRELESIFREYHRQFDEDDLA
jgi:hypothetical protein